ncbi:MAG TPA: glycosyltransferase [Verrucomicrobiae bacterium]|jgi:glycosyltransferase involved in cell wall biosynthesis|nr:glycosyltransferase [Verrucomicrobiae bacterium]
MSDKTLRFCMVTTFYPPYNFGGDGIFVHRLANELARRGHRVDVVHCRDAYHLMAGGEPAGAYDDHPNVTVHGLKSGFGPLSPLAAQQTGRTLFKSTALRRIFSQRFDVVHFHNISLFGPKILEYGDGVKLYTMHEYWLVCPMHTLYKFNRAPCTKPDCFACTLVYKRPPQWWRYSGLLEAAVKQVDAFIAPSRFIADKHHEMGFAAPIVHLPYFVPDAVDDGLRPERATAEVTEKPYFLFVGRLEKLKGAQSLIPVFRKYPRARLLIAGTGNDERKLRRLAEGSDNIQFLGRLSDGALQPLYRHAVALIVPSLWFENLPLVIMEAFRQKTPVIARNLGAMREIIQESGGGFIYDDEKTLVDALARLTSDRAYRDTLGRWGHQTYAAEWGADAHLNTYFELIRNITVRRRSSTIDPLSECAKSSNY